MIKWFFVAIAMIGFLNWYTNKNDSMTDVPAEIVRAQEQDVILYSTAWCGYCRKTRVFLEKNGIGYQEYDIEKSATARQQYNELNGNGVPLLVVNSEIIRGYSPNAIVNALNRE